MKQNIKDNRDYESRCYEIYQVGNVVKTADWLGFVIHTADNQYMVVNLADGHALTMVFTSLEYLAEQTYDDGDAVVEDAEINGVIE